MTKAYMSDPTDSEELRHCLRNGKDAGAELAKILADTEAGEAFHLSCKRGSSPGAWTLLEALRDVTADGGPLDQLAHDSQAQHDALVDAEQCCHYVTHTDLPRDLADLGQALYFTAGAVLAGYDGARA